MLSTLSTRAVQLLPLLLPPPLPPPLLCALLLLLLLLLSPLALSALLPLLLLVSPVLLLLSPVLLLLLSTRRVTVSETRILGLPMLLEMNAVRLKEEGKRPACWVKVSPVPRVLTTRSGCTRRTSRREEAGRGREPPRQRAVARRQGQRGGQG